VADVLIIGAGAAGSACAAELREQGFGGSILLVGREPDPPYERPFLSKDYMRGALDRPGTHLAVPDDVDLRSRSSVMKLDPAARRASLAGGEEVEYEHALLATGANVRRLRVDGCQLDGIHYLRALANADAIRAEAEAASQVVLVGGSYIACEVAATLTSLGKRCTLIMQEETPMSTGFGADVGRFVGEQLREHGIEWRGADPLERFEGSERVQRVVTASGEVLEADMVVMGTGAVPDVMLARSAGLELGETGGVACDSGLRTSAEGVWAAGDPCEYDSVIHGRRLRVEHFEVARAQGAHAARAMLGDAGPYVEVPYFWTDLGDWLTLEYVGPAETWDREELRGSFEDGSFAVLYHAGDRLVACLAANRPDDLEEARAALAGAATAG
jgi:3-phenylpropionate/trans-cinnamate dioxygenase ferredoxin reductase subunit